MKIANYMSPTPVTITSGATIDQARALMRERRVRHLPVIQDEQVIGLITDQDLWAAWLPSLLTDLTVKDLMKNNPCIMPPETSIYQAARTLYENKLTGLLVMDQGRLLGIVTLADMLKVFVEILGLLQESTRLDVLIKNRNEAEAVRTVIHQQGGSIMSVAQLNPKDGVTIYSFRLEGREVQSILEALTTAGFSFNVD